MNPLLLSSNRSIILCAILTLSAGLAASPTSALAEDAAAPENQTTPEEVSTQTTSAQPTTSTSDLADTDTESQPNTVEPSAPSSPAPASNLSNYQSAGLHALTINYQDEKGNLIAPSYKQALADGESFQVTSPTIGGYELLNPEQASIQGSVSKGDGDLTISVTYASTMSTYKVIHERQVGPQSSEYRVSEVETFKAPAGTTVQVAPKTYDNYICSTKDFTLEVTPDGKATITVQYDVIVPTYGIYFQTGGTYIAPITGHIGDTVVAPEEPTRAGYTFAGWDTNGDGQADALPTSIPASETKAVALWTPSTATYRVKYWGEDQNNLGHYVLLKTETLQAETESTTPLAAKLHTAPGETYEIYEYSHEDPVQVSGDGSAILNVYYDFKKVKVYFKAYDSSAKYYMDLPDLKEATIYKFEELIFLPTQEETILAYRNQGGTLKNFLKWYDPKTKIGVAGRQRRIKPTNVYYDRTGNPYAFFVASFTDSTVNTRYCKILLQEADGVSYETYHVAGGDETFRKDSSVANSWRVTERYIQRGYYQMAAWRISQNVWNGQNESDIIWSDWHSVSKSDINSLGNVISEHFDYSLTNVFEVKYDRIPFDVTYYSNGEVVATKTQLYGSTIDVSTPKGLVAPDGLVFGGWYTDTDFAGQPVDSLTMPVGGVHLYALWKHPDVTVTFDSANGTEAQTVTIPWDTQVGQPANPTREGYEFGGWYYQATSSSTPAPFSFDLNLEGDTRLVAAWKSRQIPVAYTVIHKTKTGEVLTSWSGTGTVGQTVTELALGRADTRRAGYRYVNASGITLDLAADVTKNVYEFTYDNDTLFRYVVHFYDAETGLLVAQDADFESEAALLNYTAPHIVGYHVLDGGQGYVSTRDGGKELTFWYQKDPAPKPPAQQPTPTQQPVRVSEALASIRTSAAPYTPKHITTTPKSTLPQTSDPTDASIPAGVSLAGAILALLGLKGARKKNA